MPPILASWSIPPSIAYFVALPAHFYSRVGPAPRHHRKHFRDRIWANGIKLGWYPDVLAQPWRDAPTRRHSSAGAILVRAAGDPTFARASDGRAGDQARVPVRALRPHDPHPAVAERASCQQLRGTDVYIIARRHGAVKTGTRR